MKLILLGAPGAGKGTQAQYISEKLSIPTISTGNIIREAMREGTQMGIKAKSFVDKGNLVPDEVVIGIIQERLSQNDCANGFILDGFPRTIPQALALDEMGIAIDKVLSIEVADDDIVRRMSGRRVCPACGASYHIEYKKPAKEGICNLCGAQLTIRDDDKPQTVLERLKIYHDQTEPLKDYYKKQDKLLIVQGQEELKETTRLTFSALELDL